MAHVNDLQIPPPNDDVKFEQLCRELWSRRYEGYNAQRIGTQGQPQHGVDILLNGPNGYIAIQCKKRQYYGKGSLTEKKAEKITRKACKGPFRFSEFIIATTESRKTKFAVWAQKLTGQYEKNKLTVKILAWEDILELLNEGNHADIIAKYCQTSVGSENIQLIKDSLADIKETVAAVRANTDKPWTIPSADLTHPDMEQEYRDQLNEAKGFLDQKKPETALAYLLRLKERIWERAPYPVKYRLLSLLGTANFELDKDKEAAHFFIEALQYNPDDEKALLNASYGCLFANDHEQAKSYAEVVLRKNKANCGAHAVMVNLWTDSIDDLLEEIPRICKESVEVAFAIAHLCHKKGDLSRSEEWLKIAEKNNAGKIPNVPATLAQVILERITKDTSILQASHLDPNSRKEIERARDLLKVAWNMVQHTELARLKVSWLADLGFSKRLLNDLDHARQDFDSGLELDPNNLHLRILRASCALEMDDSGKALNVLSDIDSANLREEDVAAITVLKADALRIAKRNAEAASILEQLLLNPIPLSIKNEARQLLIRIDLEQGFPERALTRSQKFLELSPDDLLIMAEQALILAKTSKREDALAVLHKAKLLITDLTPKPISLALADAYYLLNCYQDAIGLYERAIEKIHASTSLGRLVYSYYRWGRPEEALKICRSLREKYGPLKDFTEIEILIHYNVEKNLVEAESICKSLLEVVPRDEYRDHINIMYARICLGLKLFQQADEFLDSINNFSQKPLDWRMNVAGMMVIRGRVKQALELYYETRRKFFSNPKAHLGYLGLLLNKSLVRPEDMRLDTVQGDCAVCVQKQDGSKQWYILENRLDADNSRNEFELKHPLVQTWLNKKVGEQVVIQQNALSEETGTIVSIESKYSHACKESMDRFSEWFPESHEMMKVIINKAPAQTKEDYDNDNRETSLEDAKANIKVETTQQGLDIKAFLEKTVAVNDERRRRIEELYKSGKLPVGAVAELIGRNVIDVWAGLGSHEDLGIRCCIGGEQERKDALTLLESGFRLIADIIALKTILNIGIADAVVSVIGKLGIAQSTIDLIQDTIFERKALLAEGFMTLSKQGDKFVMKRTTSDEIKESVTNLERSLVWIEKNCEIIPCRRALGITMERKKKLDGLIGESFADTMLIAQEKGNILYSDDMMYRQFAYNEFKVRGVWTQAVLMHCLVKNSINREEYNRSSIDLVAGNYHYTSIDGQIIAQAAKDEGWTASRKFQQVISVLRADSSSDLHSALNVTTDFLFYVWTTPIAPLRRSHLLLTTRAKLLQRHNSSKVIAGLVQSVKQKFRLLPLAEREILAILKAQRQIGL